MDLMSQILDKPDAADEEVRENVDRAAKNEQSQTRVPSDSAKQLLLGLLFGVVFGFLLQKAGVAKYHILMGQLLLTDFTVLKVMMSAVIVGMLGVHFMHAANLVELHIKPTRYLANCLGGLLFGVGFALSAYCPGTGAAAIGQGNIDAIAMVAGMIAGSYLFAEASGYLSRVVEPIGERGKLTLADVVTLPRPLVILGAISIIGIVLAIVETLPVR